MFSNRLKALCYPGWRAFNPEDDGQASVLLSWLEDTKIRLWKIEERRSIRVVSSSGYKDLFPNEAQRQYLECAGCPQNFVGSKVRLVSWLINHAISLEYRDLVDEQDEDLKEIIQKEDGDLNEKPDCKEGGDEAGEITLSNENSVLWEEERLISNSNMNSLIGSAEWKRKVQKLCFTLGTKFPENVVGQVQVIRAIANLICRRFKNGLCEPKKAPEEDTEKLFTELCKVETSADCDEEIVDADISRIWCTLLLLNVAELEMLQGEINDLLGVIQTFTANPKVNPSLGAIGK